MYGVASDANSFTEDVKSVQRSLLFECISSETLRTKVISAKGLYESVQFVAHSHLTVYIKVEGEVA